MRPNYIMRPNYDAAYEDGAVGFNKPKTSDIPYLKVKKPKGVSSRSKITPGPWMYYSKHDYGSGLSYGIRAPQPHFYVVPAMNISSADVRLMSAAPDLLEALELLMSDVAGCQQDEKYQKAREAIEKAIGE